MKKFLLGIVIGTCFAAVFIVAGIQTDWFGLQGGILLNLLIGISIGLCYFPFGQAFAGLIYPE